MGKFTKFGVFGLAALVLGLGLFAAAPARAVVMADIVFIIDTSGSMGDDIAQVKSRIGDFNTAMTNAGIDAHYGLVRFGGAETLIQDIVPFATFNAGGSPFQLLTANGGANEDGSDATNVALTATYRAGSVKNLILITDEDDDSSVASFNAANAGLGGADALFNFIGVPGVGNTDSRYGVLAANHGGAAFSITAFRSDPDPFFDNFTATKVQEIQQAGGAAPEPVTAALSLAGLFALGLCAGRRRGQAA